MVPETSERSLADRYTLVRALGQGAMGRVWLARDEVLRRDVAVKELVPPPGLTEAETAQLRERSLREARAIAQLSHANAVRIFDVLIDGGDPWIVMEFIPSEPLHSVLRAEGPMSPARTARIGLAILGALAAAHRVGVLHRDVKPANVLLGTDGRVMLTDFGLAAVEDDPGMTRTGIVLGSPAYLAPERAVGDPAGPASDLWSLGATLYAAVEGRPPYARPSSIATLAALATELPAPPRRAGALFPVLEGLLRKDPARRITAVEAEALLHAAAQSEEEPARPRPHHDGHRAMSAPAGAAGPAVPGAEGHPDFRSYGSGGPGYPSTAGVPAAGTSAGRPVPPASRSGPGRADRFLGPGGSGSRVAIMIVLPLLALLIALLLIPSLKGGDIRRGQDPAVGAPASPGPSGPLRPDGTAPGQGRYAG